MAILAQTQFETGSTYNMNYIGDSNLKTPYLVTRRTAKSVWLSECGTEPEKRCKIDVYDGVESCYPTGKYSMCPVLSAKRKV